MIEDVIEKYVSEMCVVFHHLLDTVSYLRTLQSKIWCSKAPLIKLGLQTTETSD